MENELNVKLRKLKERFDIENKIVCFSETNNSYDTVRSAIDRLVDNSVSNSLLEEEEKRG